MCGPIAGVWRIGEKTRNLIPWEVVHIAHDSKHIAHRDKAGRIRRIELHANDPEKEMVEARFLYVLGGHLPPVHFK